ncbi:MAG TPA: dihydroorotate dehydrogenase electron transfer subunit [Firmicutes bacterium]|nr:dihydroorotate dehydrogenase electron transfer subunit [Bacillota bacterium]
MQGDHQGILIEKKQVTPDCYLFTIESSKLALATPGQFIHILPQASWGISQDPLLRRPISLYDVSKEAQRGQILFRVVGRGTKALSQFVPGDLIDFLGPIGRGFTLPVGGPREVALVGGGIGLAPLFYLARRLIEEGHRVCAYFGFRGKDDYIPVEPFGQLGCAVEVFTEDGSRGTRGFPTLGLEQALREGVHRVYACGPVPMLAAVVELAGDVPCEVSMEERMGCGIGACLGCVCKVKGREEYQRVCVDGPVFDGATLDFSRWRED